MKKSFFSKFDWAAFWVATLVTFAVYFYTLGPSVGLEDSGELATAAAHLGVPHPPGYPFWTLCSWIFCKIFSFVTYMGHPTPAWAVSCCSAFFGALAAGCTAMLICRSSRDFLAGSAPDGVDAASASDSAATGLLCFGGGVGGALAFSFSPVEWSQSTIVEIYSLNALFLMWTFLLTYRWMRKPSDKILWFTAFVFGLGLTNYQVLLFAIVPIAIIICLRNFRMFRDFALYLIPVALTYQILQIGELQRAHEFMSSDVINKHVPLASCESAPSTAALVFAFAALVAGFAAAAWFKSRRRRSDAAVAAIAGGAVSLSTLLLSVAGVFAGRVSWEVLQRNPETGRAEAVTDITAPLVDPRIYVWVAAFVVVSVVCAVVAALLRGDDDGGDAADAPGFFPSLFADAAKRKATATVLLCASALAALAAVGVAAGFVDQADAAGYRGQVYDWASSRFMCNALIAALILLALFVKRGLSFAIPVAGFHVAAFLLLERGAMNGLVHPTSWWFWWPVVWNFTVLSLAWLVLPNGKSVAGAAFFAQLGVSFYAYMPIVSDLRNPPMNWGYPRTWDGFKHAITRGQYEAITFPEFKSVGEFWEFAKTQMGHYFADVKMQFSDFLAFFALVPFACWRVAVGKRRGAAFKAVMLGAGILAILLVRAVLAAAGLGGGAIGQAFDRILLAVMAAASLVGVALIAWRQVAFRAAVAARRFAESAQRKSDWTRLGAAAGLILLALWAAARPMYAAAAGKKSAAPFFAAVAALAAFAGLVVSVRWIVRVRSRGAGAANAVAYQARGVSQQWLLASGASFFMMTLPLIVLARVKGDLQDGFIQKVKFISSHAMVALWIGYGLVFVGAVVMALAARRRGASRGKATALAAVLAAVMVFSAAFAPIWQNYTDDQLVHELGSSEQNGHTFGWQFGAYQLEGANAIREQLTDDEEPLPDPDWPKPMEPFSIFFGGTDPGRFVPTYMIYSANFRPDVYLITQNALADETYMAVERDLYGDEIWIPAKEDSGKAFEIYVDEVKRGVRPANGDLKIENGRVQVTGALGVMEINGILTKMMWDHDRLRHSFYVEESYAIPWMYPYLSPHGLIMKLNSDRAPYDKATAAKDRDFWDWYARRLLDDPMFRRDFAAQKSFSKLRAAIAGLYRTQNRRSDAAQAFREAHLVYPSSPEATFRYVSEILLPLDRLDVIAELMDYTDALDPNGGRTTRIRSYIDLRREIDRLEAEVKSGAASPDAAWSLGAAYAKLGRVGEAASLYRKLVAAAQCEPARLEEAAFAFIAAGDDASAEKALARAVAALKSPSASTLVELALLRHRAGNRAAAYALIDRAVKSDPKAVRERVYSHCAALPEAEQDFALWLRLTRMYKKASNTRRAHECFIRAFNLAPERVQEECRRDRDLMDILLVLMDAESKRRGR